MFELDLRRTWFTRTSTISIVLLNRSFYSYALEDYDRGSAPKVPGQTAIPAGTYEMDITFSNRFQQDMPILLNVPNFQGIRIHTGNTDKDTEGCILLGLYRGVNTVTNSKLAYAPFFEKMKVAKAAGEKMVCRIGRDPFFWEEANK